MCITLFTTVTVTRIYHSDRYLVMTAIFFDVTRCSSVDRYQHFRGSK